jgi:hypothetical protein
MDIVYTLTTTQIDCIPAVGSNVDIVCRVHWAYIGTHDDSIASFGGTTNIAYNESGSFTPFADLTEEQVTGWVLSAWTPEELTSRQSIISDQLSVSKPALPWISSTTSDIEP